MREIKFEYGFTNHAPIRVSIASIEYGLDLDGIGEIKYRRQYTGLKDKNGVEIYEGDIIKWHKDDTQISVTVFHEFAFYHLFDGMYEDFNFDDGKLCEVIGNIYENKELLNT